MLEYIILAEAVVIGGLWYQLYQMDTGMSAVFRDMSRRIKLLENLNVDKYSPRS